MGVLGFLILIVLGIVGLAGGGSLGHVIDIPSALIVVGGFLSLMLMAFGSRFGTAIKTVFQKHAGRHALIFGIAVFERGRSFTVAAGVVGTMVGVVNMLANLNLDNIAALGPGLATAAITSIYCLGLAYGVLQPVVISLKRRLTQAAG